MRVLILGVDGMLGHKLYQTLWKEMDTYGTSRRKSVDDYVYGEVDIRDLNRLAEIMDRISPDVVVNCIGIVKSIAKNLSECIQINSISPHEIYQVCKSVKANMIHLSTDCVFSGKRGNYLEDDASDADDLYGRTKYLGEVPKALTIRTSMIGYELGTQKGLVEWFLSQTEVDGYTNAIFSGFPTLHLSRIIMDIILSRKEMKGVYHISSEPISKHDLLCFLKQGLGLDTKINRFDDFHCNRSLNSDKFRKEMGFTPLPWNKMIKEFVEDGR